MLSSLLRSVFVIGQAILGAAWLPVLLVAALASRCRKRHKLIWGPQPLANNKYWSNAMSEAGYESLTLMESYYRAYQRSDFDLYYDDLFPAPLRRRSLILLFGPYIATLYVMFYGTVLHIAFTGGPLGRTILAAIEPMLLRWSGVRTVVIPYGGDVAAYSRLRSPSVREGFLRSYPMAARSESKISRHIRRWTKYADTIAIGFTTDGIGRWDIPAGNMLAIDINEWKPPQVRNQFDGRSGPVKILHAPNHTGVKGTEYIENAIERLRQEELEIEYIRAEGIPNREILTLMNEVDILVDQIVLSGYGLAAVEGMACGLPVIANLEYEDEADLFRRYSYLGQCPIVSASHETLYDQLNLLVRLPDIRIELGYCGRQYVEKFHSYKAAAYLFSNIYESIVNNKNVDLRDLFHPLKSKFTMAEPMIQPPLIRNHFPDHVVASVKNSLT